MSICIQYVFLLSLLLSFCCSGNLRIIRWVGVATSDVHSLAVFSLTPSRYAMLLYYAYLVCCSLVIVCLSSVSSVSYVVSPPATIRMVFSCAVILLLFFNLTFFLELLRIGRCLMHSMNQCFFFIHSKIKSMIILFKCFNFINFHILMSLLDLIMYCFHYRFRTHFVSSVFVSFNFKILIFFLSNFIQI